MLGDVSRISHLVTRVLSCGSSHFYNRNSAIEPPKSSYVPHVVQEGLRSISFEWPFLQQKKEQEVLDGEGKIHNGNAAKSEMV